jgi:polygalacturonase
MRQRFLLTLAGTAILALPSTLFAPLASAQDTRTVTEPVFPATCTILAAQQAIVSGEPASETTLDTTRIQSALTACPSGQAVELTASGSNNAFLSGSLTIAPGKTLIVDGGVTLFASRNPADYQITGLTEQCGTVGTTGNACNPFITFSTNTTATPAGLMGYGIINGRGGDKIIIGGVVNSESWWDLANDARSGGSQNCPILVQLSHSNNAAIYKITLLNSPHFHVKNNSSTGFTVWDAKISTPWTARNTDGIDPSGVTNMTVRNSFIGDGDDEIAISGSSASSGFSFTNLQLSSGHGISIGSITTAGVSNVVADGVYFSGQAADGNQVALRIKSAQDHGGLVNNVTYKNVCIKNTRQAIQLDPFYDNNAGTLYPQYQNITFANLHVLSGSVTPRIEIAGYDANHLSTVTFDNVVFDSGPTISPVWQNSTISFSNAISGTPTPQVYPAALSTNAGTGITYTSTPTISNANTFSCANVFAPLVTEMYASSATATNLQTVALTNPGSITLNATIEPANSTTTYTYTGGSYIGAAVPNGTVQFLEGATVVGTGTLGSNGTLASATITNPTVGTHTYTANYVNDTTYATTAFGSITVTATAGPDAQLAFSTPPPASLTYGAAAGTVTVAVQDTAGDTTSSTAIITLTVIGTGGYSQVYTATAVVGTATFNLGTILPAGTYTYTASASGLTPANAAEAVSPATLTVTATAASRIFGAPNPAFAYAITGFVNNDPSSVVSGAPVITTTAVRTSPAASYPTSVSIGTLSAANYNFLLVGGTLTVTGNAPQSILFSPLPNFTSGATYQLTARSTSGLPTTYTVTGPAQISGSSLTIQSPGLITITASNPGDSNYAAATSVSQTFTAQ